VLALLPDGACEQGSVAEMLDADRLQRVYGCAWRRIDGGGGQFWIAQ
jgi:hypothetical protein